MKTLVRLFVAATLVASPVLAQRGGGGAPPVRDTTQVRTTPDGAVLDFRNADISIVLSAIAEAGNLNISMSRMQQTPPVTVTLRVSQRMTPQAATEMVRVVAEGVGFTVTESESIIRVVGPAPAPAQPNAQQQALLAMQQRNRVLNTVRLKHATASQVAPLLLNLVRGTGTFGTQAGRGNVPAIGGVNIPAAGGGAQGGGAQGGRGGQQGRGGGGAQGGGAAVQPQVIQIPGGAAALGGGRGAAQLGGLGALLGLAGGAQAALGANLQFTDMSIVADEGTNSLLILATQEDFQAIAPLLQSIDVRPLQVLIEVTIAQVERTNDLNVGISGVTSKSRTEGTGAQQRTITDTTALLPSAASARDFITQLIGGKGSVDYRVAMNALQSRGDVKVLSLPLIIAQNNRQAVLNVGSRVPFVQVSQTVPNDPTGRVETIQYQDVGTTLTITPTINTDGYVNLAVAQTSDNLSNNFQFDAQIINQRQAQTTVFVRDGQTVVIGGLADNSTSKSRTGIPFLSRIPLIGWLFGNSVKNETANELFLFLTPHIVSSDEDIDRLRESVRSTTEMLDGVPLRRLNRGGDTLQIGLPPDSVRRRPPDGSVPDRQQELERLR